MENIVFQYPFSWFLACSLLGVLFTAILYFKEKKFRNIPIWLKGSLIFSRFLTSTIIAVLLLGLYINRLTTEEKKPIIVFAQDNSESVIMNLSDDQLNIYQANINSMIDKLSEKYEVNTFSFGSEVRNDLDWKFEDKITNISVLFSHIYDVYANQNLVAIILATDGIYNQGSNPLYQAAKMQTPVYSVSLGDTTPQKDIYIKDVFHNKIAYLGDKFTIQVDVAAQNCASKESVLTLSKDGVIIEKIPLTINKNNFFTTKELILDAKKSGVQKYKFSVNSIQGEVTKSNNSKEIYIDVLDARQKVLIMGASPHPDLAAIKESILKNKNYEVKLVYPNEIPPDFLSYNLVVLHQLPSQTNSIDKILTQWKKNRKPILYVIGSQSNLRGLNGVQNIVEIKPRGGAANLVQGVFSETFSLFTLKDKLKNEVKKFAPLIAPFGDYIPKVGTQTLMYQKIGKVDTKYPLIAFSHESGKKEAIILAEGIWKWRLFDFLHNENHETFDELMFKIIQYQTVKEDKRRFRMYLSKNIFNENEEVSFQAELYNESYELINEPDVLMKVTNEKKESFDFSFNKINNSYFVNIGVLPVGNYTYESKVIFNEKELRSEGKFSIVALQLELFHTTANHRLLYNLSNQFGGSVYQPNQITVLKDSLFNSDTIKPVIFDTSKTNSILNYKGLFFILLFFLALEWFLLRYYGGY